MLGAYLKGGRGASRHQPYIDKIYCELNINNLRIVFTLTVCNYISNALHLFPSFKWKCVIAISNNFSKLLLWDVTDTHTQPNSFDLGDLYRVLYSLKKYQQMFQFQRPFVNDRRKKVWYFKTAKSIWNTTPEICNAKIISMIKEKKNSLK